MAFCVILSVMLIMALVDTACGHAHLVEPPSRNILKYRLHQENSPHSYQAGGIHRVKARSKGIWPTFKDPSSHGLCGDPRQNGPEPLSIADMKYMEPSDPQRSYVAGSIATFEIGVSAHHMGHFEFRICDRVLDKSLASAEEGQECLNTWTLHRAPRSEFCGSSYEGDCQPLNPNHPERWYLPPRDYDYTQMAGPDWSDSDARPVDAVSNQVYRMRYVIPADLYCEHCTLQWYYATGNSCAYDEDYFLFDPGFRFFQFYKEPWATCNRHCCQTGGAFGEEFWNCADITVVKEGDTTAEPSSTSQVEDTCQSWCASDGNPWSARCTWSGCSGCPECGQDVSTSMAPVTTTKVESTSTTAAETSSTAELSTTSRLEDNCASWCAASTWAAWSTRCTWQHCIGCSECDQAVSTTSMTTVPTTTAETSTTTAEMSTTTAELSTTTTMVGTSTTKQQETSTTASSSSEPEPEPEPSSSTTRFLGTCKWWCVHVADPWSARCTWSDCEGCGECHSVSTTADPSCSSAWNDCRGSRCCRDPSLTCYEKSQWWAACRPSCTPDDGQDIWSCNVLTPNDGRRLRGA